MEHVILVDHQDNEMGTMEKMEAHQKGVLHRAFSILIFNSKGEMLIQQRSHSKYHSAGLWSNACCSHPRPGEPIEEAVPRRLKEEMGIDVQLKFAYKFIYKTLLENNLIEHELDHVFIGKFDGVPVPDPAEVADWQFISISALQESVNKKPGEFTPWFNIILNDWSKRNTLT